MRDVPGERGPGGRRPAGPGSDELTPTSKLRRDVIAGKYAQEIDELYG